MKTTPEWEAYKRAVLLHDPEHAAEHIARMERDWDRSTSKQLWLCLGMAITGLALLLLWILL